MANSQNKAKADPLAKRRDETDLDYRRRVALAALVRPKAEPVVNAPKGEIQKLDESAEADRMQSFREVITPQAKEKGELEKGWLVDEDGNMQNSYRRKSRSALAYMRERGSLTDDQYGSAMEIASVAEMIESSVASSGASMEARVDCSGSARDALNESLYRVRAEGAYTEWRSKLPLPRRMVIDMVTRDAGLSAIAAAHNMGWPKARRILVEALKDWPGIMAKYCKRIDQAELDRAHERLQNEPSRKCA